MNNAKAETTPILSVRNLDMGFPENRPVFNVLHNISLDVFKGETLGLVGESGCGKTTLGRCILRVYKPGTGEVIYRPDGGAPLDIAKLNDRGLKPIRHDIRMIFQDPWSSLNPRMTVFDVIAEPLRNTLVKTPKSEMEDRVVEIMLKVGLRPDLMTRYPYAFSGGQRQRIGIARALVVRPKIVVADEAVSALDVSVRAQILNLLNDLREELDLTFIFISHDLGVVRQICDRVAVMYAGNLVEVAETEELFRFPQHPYSEALMSAVPRPDPNHRRTRDRKILRGEVPDAGQQPPGCAFHPRCLYAEPDCAKTVPEFTKDSSQHQVRCLRQAELSLEGISPHE